MAAVVGEKGRCVIINSAPTSFGFVQIEETLQQRYAQFILLCQLTQDSNFGTTLKKK